MKALGSCRPRSDSPARTSAAAQPSVRSARRSDVVGCQLQPHRPVQQGQGLFVGELQVGGPDLGQLSPGSHPGQRQRRVGTGRQRHVDACWEVVQEQGQGPVADRVGDQVVVVQDQEQRQPGRAQLVEQSRQDRPVQVRAWAPQGRQRAPPYARLDGAERLHHIGPEPCGVVVALVQRDPGHPASARDRAPLGQQRRLAEAGRSVHQAELALQAELEQRLEAGPRYEPGPSGRRPQLGPHQLGTRRTHRLRRAMVRPVHADGHGGGVG